MLESMSGRKSKRGRTMEIILFGLIFLGGGLFGVGLTCLLVIGRDG